MDNTMNYDKFFKEISRESSGNAKLKLLEGGKADPLLKEIVRLTLDPFTNFYIRKIPEYTSTFGTMSLSDALDSLAMLSKRAYTGAAGIDWLKNILQHTLPDDALVIERIINRDLACGVSTATVNKVWPGLIAKYPVMLCSPYDEKLIKKIIFPAIVQRKEDGMRFNAIILDGNVTFFSRSGKPIDLLGNLESEFRVMASNDAIVYDGELLVLDERGNYLDRKVGNGILNKAVKGTISIEEASRVVAVLWDHIGYNEFMAESGTTPYYVRLAALSYEIDKYPTKKIRLVEKFLVSSLNQVQGIFEQQLSVGHEGIILKDSCSVWESKRSTKQIKFKAELDCDLYCVAIEEGTGKYTGMIGSLLCQSKDCSLTVSVGTGLTDELRKSDPKNFLDKIIAVKYNARIEDRNGNQSLFLPVFLEVRLDKETADRIEDIK